MRVYNKFNDQLSINVTSVDGSIFPSIINIYLKHFHQNGKYYLKRYFLFLKYYYRQKPEHLCSLDYHKYKIQLFLHQ